MQCRRSRATRPPRPISRDPARSPARAVQNAAFLAALRRTGNAREAARSLGVNRSTFTKRRAKHRAFAAEWDAALAFAHARLGPRAAAQPGGAAGEVRMIRTASGRVQLRRQPPRRLTRAAEQAFLAALSATANVRLSAAAAGFSHSAFYQRRQADPGFAREMRLALEMGYRRLEMALLESFEPDSHAQDGWRHNEPPPIPSMSPAQALQLMYLHQKEVMGGTPEPMRLRHGETAEIRSMRLQLMYELQLERSREEYRLAEAARRRGGASAPAETPPPLPALDQVTGWSKASGKPAWNPDLALFGGWRLKDWEE